MPCGIAGLGKGMAISPDARTIMGVVKQQACRKRVWPYGTPTWRHLAQQRGSR